MGGSSLWLLPPKNHPLDSILLSLIQTTSAHFSSPHLFIPHVTLTSEVLITTYASDPQKWLDGLDLPTADSIRVRFERLQSEDVFVRKLYVKVGKDGVAELGMRARQQAVEGFGENGKARAWAEEKYNPHLSLLYHDCPKVSKVEIANIETLVKEAGITLEGEGELCGWEGGRVVLVPTDQPIPAWQSIAERLL